MTLDALHLWHSTAPKLSLDDCEGVLEALRKRGYRLEPQGSPGQCVGVGDYVNLAKAITRDVPVHHRDVPVHHRDVLVAFTGINHLQYAIRKPL